MTSQGAAPKKTPAADLPPLPVVSLARMEEVTLLIERLFTEKADVFIAAAEGYRERHRTGSSRPLTHLEAAQVAQAMAAQPDVGLVEAVQDSGLRAYDEPSQQEVLLAAGLQTAPAFIDLAIRVTALIELDADTFEQACETYDLDAAIDRAAKQLRKVPISDARARASRALEHFARGAGTSPGEAWRLLTGTVLQAFAQGMSIVAEAMPESSSLTGSPPSTGGPDETSST